MSDPQDIVLKAWDTYQSLIAALGDDCWKIRSVFYTVSFGLIAAAFSSDLPGLYLLTVPLAALFFVLEAGYKGIQQQYIKKTIEVEVTITDILAGEPNPRMPDTIGTSLEPPSFKAMWGLFTLNRYLFWMSYIAVIVIPLLLFSLNWTQNRFTAPTKAPCATACCPCPATPVPPR
jgi:hypothetical protein